MNTLTFEKFKIMGANMGEESCLPDIKNDEYIRAPIAVADSVSEEDKKHIGKGMIPTLLPYKIQNGYDRARKELLLDAAVLENEYLKATFVPELGGRLWSLYDKKAEKELLYANNVFQPGNLALRNAWFSGGVEWNVGIKGHNPLTCSPLFAQKLTDENGVPMLRMYEFERIREVTYSIVAKLEKDVLLVNVTIENTSDEDKYMYWWSNIAVEETEKTRVIVPTGKSFYCAYEEGAYVLGDTEIPYIDGTDVSYATNLNRSRDFFYKIPENEKKWITAVNEKGYGLVHMSTSLLHGRKLFAWGQGEGGKHWNRWLSDCGKSYIEIQAGLMKTQLEHFIMKANSTITWTEGYSMVHANATFAHGENFDAAIDEIKGLIADKQDLVENGKFIVKLADAPAYLGSGWGAIENMLRENPVSKYLVFPCESMSEEQQDWLTLILEGELPEADVQTPIKSYVKGLKWIEMLEKAPDNWNKYYHLGVLYFISQDMKASYAAFEKSNALYPNAWSYRNLAQLEKNEYHNNEKAVEYMKRAVEIKNNYQPLWVNYAEAMIAAERYSDWTEEYDCLSEELKNNGRLKMLYSFCLVKSGRYKEALEIIKDNFEMPDIREGEFSISHIWLEIHKAIMRKDGILAASDKEVYEKYPLPANLDFRMH